MSQPRFKVIIDPAVSLDDFGNTVVIDQPTGIITNCNPVLNQVMALFYDREGALTDASNDRLHELGDTLLAANNYLGNVSFWNDIDGFIGEYGRPVPFMSAKMPEVEKDPSLRQVYKRDYLSEVVIPTCIGAMVVYLQTKVKSQDIPADGPDMTDAYRLRRLLEVLPRIA